MSIRVIILLFIIVGCSNKSKMPVSGKQLDSFIQDQTNQAQSMIGDYKTKAGDVMDNKIMKAEINGKTTSSQNKYGESVIQSSETNSELYHSLQEFYRSFDEEQIEYLKSNNFAHSLLRHYFLLIEGFNPYTFEVNTKYFNNKINEIASGTIVGPEELPAKYSKYAKESFIEELPDIRHRLLHSLYKGGYYSLSSIAAAAQVAFDYYLTVIAKAKDEKMIAEVRELCINKLQNLEMEIINNAPVFVVWFDRPNLVIQKRQKYALAQFAQTIKMLSKFEVVIYGIVGQKSAKFKKKPVKITKKLQKHDKVQRSQAIAQVIKDELIKKGVSSRRIYAAAGLGQSGPMSSGLDGDRAEIHIR